MRGTYKERHDIMKIDKKYKIESASSADATRQILNSVYIDKTEGESGAQAIATNGRIMAMVPVELRDGDKVGVIVSPKAFAAARKACGKLPDAHIELNGSAKVTGRDGEQSFPYVEGTFPNYRQVLPKEYKNSVKVTFDAKRLFALWKAIGGEDASNNKVTLEIDSEKDSYSPIKVTTDGDGKGILMPMRTA